MQHKTHLEIEDIRCSDCHSRVVHAPRGQQRPKMTEEGCESCHNGVRAFSVREKENCVQCHQTKFEEQEVGTSDQTCYICHGESYIREANRKVVEDIKLLVKDGWQYINMNHGGHLENEIECLECHSEFVHGTKEKVLPDHDVCSNCHDEVTDTESCDMCHSGI